MKNNALNNALYWALALLATLKVVLETIIKFGYTPFVPVSTITYIAIKAGFYIAIPLLILTLIHFGKNKLWLISVALIIHFGIGLLIGYEQGVMMRTFRYDFTWYELLLKLSFWVSILVSAACILADRGRLSWLGIYGAALGLDASIAQLYHASGGHNFDLLIKLISIVPGILFACYFWTAPRKSVATKKKTVRRNNPNLLDEHQSDPG